MGPKHTQSNARRISASIAPVIEFLEQREQTLVTSAEIARFLDRTRSDPLVKKTLQSMRTHGWLKSLPLKGVYEFLPLRFGPNSSGDAWLELRLLRSTERNLHVQVGLASAAFLRGYAERQPRRQFLIVDKEQSLRPRMRDNFRIIRTKPERLFGADELQGLPVSTASRLLIECVLYWKYAGSLSDPDHWLRAALEHASPREVRNWSRRIGPSFARRVGYVAERFGATDVASRLVPSVPARSTTVFGPKSSPGKFNAKWGVYDTLDVAGSRP